MPEWDELFKEERFRWQEPDEEVVALAQELKRRKARRTPLPAKRVLDLGFGAGRHVVYLAREGFEVCGTDISPRGLELTQQWLRKEGRHADLRLSDMSVIPYPDQHFDAVISTYVIHHNSVDNIRRCVAEIHRVLVPGGKALLIVQSSRGYRYGQGQELEPGTYITASGADAGIPHHFFGEDGLRDLLADFVILRLSPREHVDGEGHRHAHWVVVASRE